MGKLKLLVPSLVALGCGSTMLATTMFPIYEVEGVISGPVALAWYRLMLYGSPLKLSSLDALNMLSAILNSAALLSVVAGFLAAYKSLKGSSATFYAELLLGSAAIYASVTGLLLGSLRVLDAEVAGLSVNFSGVTSAGYLHLGSSQVRRALAHVLFDAPIPVPIILAAAYLAIAAYAYLASVAGRTEGER